MSDLVERLRELSAARWDKEAWERETTVRIPAEPERDIDLVLSSAADEIKRLRAELQKRALDVLAADRQAEEALAELAAIKGQEPVGEVDGFGMAWWRERPPQGTKLYALPVAPADKDAERYRWLRTKVGVFNDGYYGVWLPCGNSKILEKDWAVTDAAIDAAMAKGE